MSTTPLTAELFLCGVYDYNEEAFNMQRQLMGGEDLVGGVSPNPTLPNIVSLDLQQPFNELQMLTNNLRELDAPRELCVRKALELISYRANYEISIEAFRMDLLFEVMAGRGEEDVNALIKGIRCLGDFLLTRFDHFIQSSADFFPYEFYYLHNARYLYLNKIVLNANVPAFRPATVVQPAYAYPEVQARNRTNYIAETDQCIIL